MVVVCLIGVVKGSNLRAPDAKGQQQGILSEAGTKAMQDNFNNKEINENINKKPSAVAENNPIQRPTTLTSEVSLPEGTSNNAELKDVVAKTVEQTVKNYQQITSKKRRAGEYDIIGSAGATGTMGGPNSVMVSPVVGPEPATETAKKLKKVQQDEAVKDIDFAAKVAERLQQIEAMKKKCEEDYENAKAKLRDDQAKREAEKRAAIYLVTGENDMSEMEKESAAAAAKAEEAKARLRALIKRLQDEYAASKAKASDSFQAFIGTFASKIDAEKADWEKKKEKALADDAGSGDDVVTAVKAKLEEYTEKKAAVWSVELSQIEAKRGEFVSKWDVKKKELDARIAELKKQIEAIDAELAKFVAELKKKAETRARNRKKDAENILKKQKGEKPEEMEEEGKVSGVTNPDEAIKSAMVASEKAAQASNAANAKANQAPAKAAEKPKKVVECKDRTKVAWLCDKALANNKCTSQFAVRNCARFCEKNGVAGVCDQYKALMAAEESGAADAPKVEKQEGKAPEKKE
jgi:hypothetical protein